MTEQQVQNILNYLGAIGIAILLAGGIVLQAQMASGDPIDWKPVGAAALAALITALRTSMLAKVGDEQKAQVTPDQLDAIIERLHPLVVEGLTAAMKTTPAPRGRG